MGIAAVLGHAVDLQHVQAQALVPVQQRLGHRRRAAQGNAHGIEPQAGEDLAPDEAADQWQAQQAVQLLGGHLLENAHLELGPDARHAEDRRGPRAAQVAEEGVEAFGEEHRLPGIEGSHLDEHPLGHVAQRQVRQQAIALTGIEQLHAMLSGEGEVAEALHDALGRAGGAGGVDDGGELLGTGAGVVADGGGIQQVRPGVVEGALGVDAQRNGRHTLGNPAAHGRPVVQLADERQGAFGMLQHLADGLTSEVGVQGHRNVPGHPDRQVGHDPVGTVLGNDRDAAARGEVAPPEPTGGASRLVADIAPGQLFHLAARHGLHQVTLVGMTCFTLEEHVERQTDCISHRASSFLFL